MGVSMAQNWLRITHQDGKIQLSWQRGLSAPRSAPPVSFEHPFDEETLTDLRWYLEKFLPFPYGIFPNKAKKIEHKFQEWGQRLFELVFPRNTKAWDFFCEATREGLDKCEINISSDDPTVLNLPWELLYSLDYQFLAPSLAGMYRSLSGHPVRAEMGKLPQDKLNILLVIARPYGEKDVALKTIARPLLEALKPIQKYVNLKVLRPPSFEEFERELNAHKGFYHIVHFDGHGNFDPDSTGFQYSFGSKGQGVLVFENIDGSPQIITATQIAQSLNDCRVPIFVLNACKSAQEGDGSFSSVATRLVSLGAKGVVAMSYNVQVEAAKHFIGRFYQQLVLGTDVSTAVAAARRQVINQRLRPSPKGDFPLADWIVPVLYQQETCTPFVPTSNSTEDILDIENFLEEPVSNLVGFPEQGRYGFIGRDYDILRLERAFRQNNVVLLQGMGGVGKTELTAGFARWLEETQGREKIFFTFFESGASLSRVVNEVGRAAWGNKFSQYAAEQQQRAVLKYLQSQPCLLIWDNFEPVAGFPERNEPLLSADELDDLKRFLKELRGGKTWVLITSRREETWLDCGYSLVNLQGLSPVDAQEFAAKILRSLGVEIKNLPEEYLDLLKLLGGHPFSLRVVLPHLRSQTPTQVIEALRQGLNSLEKKTEVGRDKSLTASLDYSFSKLSKKARRHLPFLGLFSERVYEYWLSIFVGKPGSEVEHAYRNVFGHNNVKASDWQQILDEATEVGILEYLGSKVYKIHPALPWYLRQKLNAIANNVKIQELEKYLLMFYAALAENYANEIICNPESTSLMLRIEESNFLHMLYLAEKKQDWHIVRLILSILGEIYKRWSRKQEFNSLRQRILNRIGTKLKYVKEKGDAAFDLWMYLQNNIANEASAIHDYEKAKLIYQQVLNELVSLNSASVNDGIATLSNNLAGIAIKLRDFDTASVNLQTALNIRESSGDFHRAAGIYLNISELAKTQRQFSKAIDYSQRALKIYENVKDLYKVGDAYSKLAEIAREQRQYEQAISHSKEAVRIYEHFGDCYQAASIYHEIGNIKHLQGQDEESTKYYHKSLKIYEDAKDWCNAADEYLQLGNVATTQHKLDDAIAYYQKALSIFKETENRDKLATVYHQLGLMLHQHQLFEHAIIYCQKALEIREEFEDWYKASDDYLLLAIIAQAQQLFELAFNFYQKAFMIFNHFQDWYKVPLTLRGLGDISKTQYLWSDSLKFYLQALIIDGQNYQEWVDLLINDLAHILQYLGETEFNIIWQEVTGHECEGEICSAIWSVRDTLPAMDVPLCS
ncbi:tetratricopeptide repeat protein [Tolypothrix sp. PCC 7601]|nr:tetratricopeptide repeat protein [Tolypothrix sp. PCC 7601]BAU04462.1 TPR repeat-containing protein [Fischerella sp. NIES-3754]BAY95041.1 TPR repeat-containing protein [Microchaete diplosiphon NIES-3275]